MPKYLYKGSYSAQGLKGMMDDGAASRVAVIEGLVGSLGGSLEAMYWAFGETDAYAIADLPDDEAAAAAALTIASAGVAAVETVKLLTAAQVDEAVGRNADYAPPSG